MEREKILAEGAFDGPFILRGAFICWLILFVSKPYMVGKLLAVVLPLTALGTAVYTLIRAVSVFGCRMTVTAERVFGQTSFCRDVDVPLKAVEAVLPGSFRSLILVSGGKLIRFPFLTNRDELCALLGERVGK